MQQLIWFDSGVNSCQGQSQACLNTWLSQEEKHLYSIRCTLFLGKIWLRQNKQSVIEKYTKEEKRQQEKKKVSESFKRDKSRENKLKGKFEYCKKNQRNYKPKNPTQYFQFQLSALDLTLTSIEADVRISVWSLLHLICIYLLRCLLRILLMTQFIGNYTWHVIRRAFLIRVGKFMPVAGINRF